MTSAAGHGEFGGAVGESVTLLGGADEMIEFCLSAGTSLKLALNGRCRMSAFTANIGGRTDIREGRDSVAVVGAADLV